MMPSATTDLANRWSRLRLERPAIRIRDAAVSLGVSELELVALGTGLSATPLATDWRSLLSNIPAVGRVMCLTRNEHCVHERHGRFEDVRVGGPHGLVLGPDIDLRLFLGVWRHGFAVREPIRNAERLSLQFFDASGEAVHKIYAASETDRRILESLIERYRAEPTTIAIKARPQPDVDRPDAEIDIEGLRDAWRSLTDTHKFFGVLKAFKVGRVQALRLAGEEFAQELPIHALRQALQAASEESMPVMIFVGSTGCIQIHTGPVRRLVDTHGWLNVLDPDFNLHLREAGIARVFAVRKPTHDGVVTSIEVFDAHDRTILLMFGARKPGEPERRDWRTLVARLAKRVAA